MSPGLELLFCQNVVDACKERQGKVINVAQSHLPSSETESNNFLTISVDKKKCSTIFNFVNHDNRVFHRFYGSLYFYIVKVIHKDRIVTTLDMLFLLSWFVMAFENNFTLIVEQRLTLLPGNYTISLGTN